MVRCSACLHDRDRVQFSRKQLNKKSQKERRCRECIANNVYPSPTIDQLCFLSSLPMGVLETIVACLSPDDQAAMFLMGLLVASQAAAQFFGGDCEALIRSSVFSNVLRSNPTAFNHCEKLPRENARLKAEKKQLRIDLLVEKHIHREELVRISEQLKEDHDLEMDALTARYIRRRDKSKTYKLLFEEEKKAANIFFGHHSNLLHGILSISRRPDQEGQISAVGETCSTVTLGHDWRDRNASRVEWENRLIREAIFAIRWQMNTDYRITSGGLLSQRGEPQHRPRPPRMHCHRCVPPHFVNPFPSPYRSCSCTYDSLAQL